MCFHQLYTLVYFLAQVITDRLSGRSKGYGFVRFTSSEERDRALSIMHGQKIGQQTIRVNRAKAKKYQGDGKRLHLHCPPSLFDELFFLPKTL